MEETQKKPPRKRHWWAYSAAALFVALLAGCGNLRYYTQAARGHFGVISETRPISEILADPGTTGSLRRKLKLVLDARNFAEKELKLEANGHYLGYADLGRDSVVYNVFAAPKLSLEPKRWWYPIIGRQSYRGYFGKQDAVDFAKGLRAEGFDIYVGGVDAYSTLGWFKDPVLNTWVNDEDEEVVSLVIHELTHQRLYISGDTAFNEAFATAVEIAGTRRWLQQKGDEAAIREWEARQARRGRFIQLIKTTRARLKQVYADGATAARSGKAGALADFRHDLVRLRTDWGNTNAYSSWLKKPVNNARLNTVSTYFELVPAFLGLLDSKAGDYEAFYAEVKRIGRMNKAERRRVLQKFDTQKNAPL
jgi:predicted aminopeptidase